MAVTVVLVLCIGGLSLTLLPGPLDHDFDALEIVVFGLTPLNLMGPFHVARRLRQDRQTAAGEVLWAWLGLVWSVLLWTWHSHRSAEVLDLMAQFSRMSVIVAVLLAHYACRPIPSQSRWAHHAGWALMECDAVVWGWYTAQFLK